MSRHIEDPGLAEVASILFDDAGWKLSEIQLFINRMKVARLMEVADYINNIESEKIKEKLEDLYIKNLFCGLGAANFLKFFINEKCDYPLARKWVRKGRKLRKNSKIAWEFDKGYLVWKNRDTNEISERIKISKRLDSTLGFTITIVLDKKILERNNKWAQHAIVNGWKIKKLPPEFKLISLNYNQNP